MRNIPENLLLLATHGSYYIPWYTKVFLSGEFKKDSYRLLKNFSDFSTKYLIPDIFPENQKVICGFSRTLGDPNRKRNSLELFRDRDFNNIRIWKIRFPNIVKDYLLKKYYDRYHQEIQSKINSLEKRHKIIIILDIHDTGNYLLSHKKEDDREKKYKFPKINLGNCDNSSSKEFVKVLSEEFEKEFNIKPLLNEPYKGGYVTQKYGIGFPNRWVVQIEFGRYLYINEKTQSIDREKIKEVRDKFMNVVQNL